MTLRRVLGAVGVILLVVLAAFLGLLALDALRWGDHLDAREIELSAVPSARNLEPETRLPVGVSRGLLGVGDDVDFREALQLFRLSRPGQPARDLGQVALRSRAETELARIARTDPSNENRARASMLRGIYAFEEARESDAQRVVFLRRSLAELRQATRLDPASEDAKYNLELVLRLLESSEDDSGGGSGGQRGDTPASGAGAASSGSGY